MQAQICRLKSHVFGPRTQAEHRDSHPAKPLWCSIRETVLSSTRTRFPFHTSSAKKLTLNQTPVITVTGKAFFDIGHSLKDQKLNRRSHLPGYAAWEIHPAMKIDVQ
jgi:hypothetical protein